MTRRAATPPVTQTRSPPTDRRGGRPARRLVVALVSLALLIAATAHAQQPVSRLKGRVVTDRGERVAGAEVRAEAFFGSGAGTFAGQRTFSTTANAKGDWSILGIAPGIWLFEVFAEGYSPESVALPIRLLTASGPNAGGSMFTWELILKPVREPDDLTGQFLSEVAAAAHGGNAALVRDAFIRLPDDPSADFLASAGRIALMARDLNLARTLFLRALERDPASYRAALGVASVFLLSRDFDSASRAFDAARSRTHDKNEQRVLSAALGDLATIKVR